MSPFIIQINSSSAGDKTQHFLFFGGLSEEETAEVLKVSPRTVRREWSLARAWLHRELKRGEPKD